MKAVVVVAVVSGGHGLTPKTSSPVLSSAGKKCDDEDDIGGGTILGGTLTRSTCLLLLSGRKTGRTLLEGGPLFRVPVLSPPQDPHRRVVKGVPVDIDLASIVFTPET